MHGTPPKILAVDDDPAVLRLLKAILRADYHLATAESGENALAVLAEFRPALVLLDLVLPGIDGFETCRRIRASAWGRNVHVIIVSAHSSREEQNRAYAAGADDYVVKPIEAHEFRARVRLHFRLREAAAERAAARAELDTLASDFERLTAAHDADIQAVQNAAVLALAKVAECRDDDTGGHLFRMRSYSQMLAKRLRLEGPYAEEIDGDFLDDLYRSSMLHDIGKVGIADAILLKPGPLTPDEFERMKQHTVIGANVLERVMYASGAASFLSMAATIARFHHERFDGTGYPAGLQGHEIPLPARIVAVADVYNALTSQRPYKAAWLPAEAKQTIESQSGRHFDPAVVRAFEACFDEFLAIRGDVMPTEVLGALSVGQNLADWTELLVTT